MVPQIYLRRLYLSIVIIIGGGIAAMAFDRGDRPLHLTMTSVAAAIAFDRGDRTLRVDGPSTVHVWCWLHARDYALLPFTAPRECDGAWAAAGFASGVP